MEILPQLIVIAIVASSIYALISAGLTLTFGTLEFINFAHGEMAMVGAYSFYTFYIQMGLPLPIALALTTILVAILGIVIERTTFRPVKDKNAFIPLILSIGITIILQSIVLMFYGGGSQTYTQAGDKAQVFELFGGQATITMSQISIIASAIILISLLYLFLKKTKLGKAIRAVSDDKQVAAIMGINVDRTIMILFAIASGLAAIAGVLIAFDQNLFPRMGLLLSIKAFAAIILGGVGYLNGAIIGAIIIGFSETLIVGLTPISSSYKEFIVFTIFIIMILFKPYGLFGGKKEERESR